MNKYTTIPQKTFAKITCPNPDPDTLALAARVAALPCDLERLILELVGEERFKLYPFVLREINWCFKYPEYAGEMVRKYQGVKLGSEILADIKEGRKFSDKDHRKWARAMSFTPRHNSSSFWTRHWYFYRVSWDLGCIYVNTPGWKRQYKNVWYLRASHLLTIKSGLGERNRDQSAGGYLHVEYNYCPKVGTIDVLRKHNVKELRRICKDNKIKCMSNKNKSEMYHALMKI